MPDRDILDELKEAADSLENIPGEDIEALLRRAADAIATLRALVGRAEVEIEDAPPVGRG